ncbi:MAG: UvrB/UvrC motif-containing protein, partial [Leptonema sp. (in: bacteria)]
MRKDIKIKPLIIMLVFFLSAGFLRGQEKDINKLFEEEIQKEIDDLQEDKKKAVDLEDFDAAMVLKKKISDLQMKLEIIRKYK